MTTHDPINAYLSNEMTPDQERQFLISVASSDSLRRALKSEVMIERMITREEREMTVPHTLRSAILAEAGVIAAAPTLPKSESPTAPQHSTPKGFRRWLAGGSIGVAGVLAGLLLSPIIVPQSPQSTVPVASAPVLAMPPTVVPVPVPSAPQVVVESADRPEQVRTVVIDRFLPGRPAANVQRNVAAAAQSNPESIHVKDYRRDNPLDPQTDRERKERGVQAGSSASSSPLNPGR